jgi:hypothetical protein
MDVKKVQRLTVVSEMVPHRLPDDEFHSPWGKIWTHGADVMTTFRKVVVNERTGEKWRPPSEYRNDFFFKINRENELSEK